MKKHKKNEYCAGPNCDCGYLNTMKQERKESMGKYRAEILTQDNWLNKPAIYEAGYGVIALCYDERHSELIKDALNSHASNKKLIGDMVATLKAFELCIETASKYKQWSFEVARALIPARDMAHSALALAKKEGF